MRESRILKVAVLALVVVSGITLRLAWEAAADAADTSRHTRNATLLAQTTGRIAHAQKKRDLLPIGVQTLCFRIRTKPLLYTFFRVFSSYHVLFRIRMAPGVTTANVPEVSSEA